MTTLLLHGLGATGAVWRGTAGLAPDLPGHGRAAWAAPYSFEGCARAVLPMLPPEPVDVVGHSMGGVVALALAALAPERVARVVGLGIKVAWSVEDVARAEAVAARPVAWWDGRDEAADRFLRMSGLTGLVDPGDSRVDTGLVEEDGRWRLAQDPRTFAVGVPDLAALLGAVTCPVVLARGEHDPMVGEEDLAALVDRPVTLAGRGHNAHVEAPHDVLALLEDAR